MSLLWAKVANEGDPPTEGRESVRHILDHYQPTDGKDWDKVRSNYVWDHPRWKPMQDDISRNGVRRPIPIDYHSDPPRVMNGHTRLLMAEKAGHNDVPVRQYHGWLDPDDHDFS